MHLIYKSADVLFILSEDEKTLFAIVGAHCQGEHVKAGLRTLKYADCKFSACKDFVSCASELRYFCQLCEICQTQENMVNYVVTSQPVIFDDNDLVIIRIDFTSIGK